MSSEKTPNLNLHKWGPDDFAQLPEFNENFEKLDGKIAETTEALASSGNELGEVKTLLEGKADGVEVVKVQEKLTDVTAQLEDKAKQSDLETANSLISQKLDKTDIVTMANMGQDIKEAMTGGSVAVVGKNAVFAENIVDKQVIPQKMSFLSPASKVNIFNPLTATDGFYINTADGQTIAPLAQFGYSDYIEVFAGETITLSDVAPLAYLVFYDRDKKFISSISGVQTGAIQTRDIVVISNAKYIRFNYQIARVSKENYKVMALRYNNFYMDGLIIKEQNLELDTLNLIATKEYVQSEVNSSFWTNKKWLAIGDSITDAATPERKYLYFIQDLIDCEIINNGLSGTGYIAKTPIHGRINALPNDADLITVFAGTNDHPYYIGKLGDTVDTTFYGAVELALSSLVNKYPLKTIAVFTPLPRRNINLKGYADAIKDVANKYSLPVLDLFNDSCFYANNTTFVANYTYGGNGTVGTGDGLHPNTAWQEILARKVLSFLNTL